MDPLIKSQLLYQLSYTPVADGKRSEPEGGRWKGGRLTNRGGSVYPLRSPLGAAGVVPSRQGHSRNGRIWAPRKLDVGLATRIQNS